MIRVDVAVIGGGLAGLTAAAAAASKGRRVVVIRRGLGTTAMTSGGLDWSFRIAPEHWNFAAAPERRGFAAAPEDSGSPWTEEALTFLRARMAEAGTHLEGEPGTDLPLMDVFGNVRNTNLAPARLAAGRIDRWPRREEGDKMLLLGVEGYSPFRPEWVARVAVSAGLVAPGAVATARVAVAGLGDGPAAGGLRLARRLDDRRFSGALAGAVAAEVKKVGARMVALPPVLGLEEADRVYDEIRAAAGETTIFELLSPPPSVPGRRLQTLLDRIALAAGAEIVPGRVVRATRAGPRLLSLMAAAGGREWVVEADEFILAAGKFAAGGLAAEGGVLSETIFGLPVHVPAPPGRPPGLVPAGRRAARELVWEWFRGRHPVFEAGLVTDDRLRPLSASGFPAYENLRAAGSILAGGNPLTDGIGAGRAATTGYAAGRLAVEVGRSGEGGGGGRETGG